MLTINQLEVSLLKVVLHIWCGHLQHALGHDNNSLLIVLKLLAHDLDNNPLHVLVLICTHIFIRRREVALANVHIKLEHPSHEGVVTLRSENDNYVLDFNCIHSLSTFQHLQL